MKMTTDFPIIVSDHAKDRFIERVKQVKREDVEKYLLTDRVKEIIQTTTTCIIPTKDYNMVVKNQTIVTVNPPSKLNRTSLAFKQLKPAYRRKKR